MRALERSSLLVVVLISSAAVSVAAIADGDGNNPPGAEANQIVAIEPEAKEALSVLEGSRTPVDALPADVTHVMDVHSDYGMNPALSRLSIGNATHSVYVIPADDHVCASFTVGEGANITCPPVADVANGQAGPATVGLADNDIAIYGIVPDGVDSISVQTGTHDSTELSVQDNAYYTVVEAGTPLRTVSYVGPSGPVEFPIYDPTLALSAP